MKIGQYKIPFDKNGNLVCYAGYSWVEKLVDNYIFEDELEYVCYGRGRSSVTFEFISLKDGRKYEMFISDFDSIVNEMKNGKIKGKFTFVKKGQNFGFKKIGE